ncbi:MAG: hypothetical protein JWM10_5320 [Myxococcaceae bacterium]|nr:hypothetical protein [Myxococcaceae bacterium]
MKKRSAPKALTPKGRQNTTISARTPGGGWVNVIGANPWTTLGAAVLVGSGFYLGWEARDAIAA